MLNRSGKLHLAVESPASVMASIQPYTDYDFVIGSKLHMTNYRREVLNRDKRRFCILDSGAFEGDTVSCVEILELAIEIEAQEIVIPDVPGDLRATMNLFGKFLDLYRNMNQPKPHIMGVIVGKTVEEMTSCYGGMSQFVDTFGFSYFKPPSARREKEFARFPELTYGEGTRLGVILKIMAMWCRDEKPFHLLGLEDPRALPIYRALGRVRSIDTSFPVKVGERNEKLSITSLKPNGMIDYEAQHTDDITTRIQENCIVMKELCNERLLP